jgi:hypothetical protein
MQSIDVFVASPNPQRLFDVAVLITLNDGAKLLVISRSGFAGRSLDDKVIAV